MSHNCLCKFQLNSPKQSSRIPFPYRIASPFNIFPGVDVYRVNYNNDRDVDIKRQCVLVERINSYLFEAFGDLINCLTHTIGIAIRCTNSETVEKTEKYHKIQIMSVLRVFMIFFLLFRNGNVSPTTGFSRSMQCAGARDQHTQIES